MQAVEPRAKRAKASAVGALIASVGASACCVVPLVLSVFGATGGALRPLETLRPFFLVITVLALGYGFWMAYRPAPACDCPTPDRRTGMRATLWITAVLSAVIALYPVWGSGQAVAGDAKAQAKATLQLRIEGMDCAPCAKTIANALQRVPGVVSASVDYDSSLATVRHDGRAELTAAAVNAVKSTGFAAHPLPAATN